MKAVVYTTIEKDLYKEWISLWKRARYANYTNSPYLFSSVLKTYQYKEYAVIGLYLQDALVGVAALVKEKRYGVSVYTVVPADFICSLPFLVDPADQQAMRVLRRKLLELGTVCLDNVPENFANAFKRATNAKIVQTATNYYLEVQNDEKGEVVIRNKRRLLRRSEAFENEFVLTDFTGVHPEALEIVFSLDKESNKQAYGYNAFANKQTQEFYRSLQKNFGNYFSVYLYYHKKKAIAYQIGFHIKQTFFCSQIAFLKSYEQYSIGRSLLIRLIETLGEKHVQVVDFGSGEDHVKRSLTKLQKPLFSLIIGKKSIERMYITYIGETKKYLYQTLQKNKSLYAAYRKVKTL